MRAGVFGKAICTRCGCGTLFPKEVGTVVCPQCRIGEPCSRCGAPLSVGQGYAKDFGFVCHACKVAIRKPRVCPECRIPSQRLSASRRHGIDVPVCDTCRMKVVKRPCPLCRAKRFLVAKDREGRDVCARCAEGGGIPFVCSECGREGLVRKKGTLCFDCYCLSLSDRRVAGILATIEQCWVADLFTEFHAEAKSEWRWGRELYLRIPRYGRFFEMLDRNFSSRFDVTVEAIHRLIGGKAMRSAEHPVAFLIRRGVLPEIAADTLGLLAESHTVRTAFAKAEGKWYATELSRFHDHMQEVRRRYREAGDHVAFAPGSIGKAVRVAQRFLDEQGDSAVRRIQDIDETHVTAFVSRSGNLKCIRQFVEYLHREQRLFRPLNLLKEVRRCTMGTVLPEGRMLELIASWLSPSAPNASVALAGLLMLVYAQRPGRMVRMTMSDILPGTDGMVRMRFGRMPVPIDPRIAPVLERHLDARESLLASRRDPGNPYLFPGVLPGSHMQADHLSQRFNEAGVTGSRLSSTGLHMLFQHGFVHPGMVAAGIGIHPDMAVLYMHGAGVLMKPELARMETWW